MPDRFLLPLFARRRLPAALCALLLALPVVAVATENGGGEGASQATPKSASRGATPTEAIAWFDDRHPDFVGPPKPALPLRLLGEVVPTGAMAQLSWRTGDAFSGISETRPVLVAHGAEPGPRLCITAAIHGDELNGIEMTRQLLFDIEPEKLAGTVVGVPIVNLHGFRQGSRYMPDRRDLNREFPGHPRGSAAARIAHSLWMNIIRSCDALVDLHTGSFHRSNLPQLRADLGIPGVAHLTHGFGATAVLHSPAIPGSLRWIATEAGIAAVTLEAGEPMRFQPEEVAQGVRGLRSLLNHLGMVPRFSLWRGAQPIFYESFWIRAEQGGILTSAVRLGERVRKGQRLGTVTDPITNRFSDIFATTDGLVLGMALNQAVIPGFAAYHLGVRSSEEALIEADPPTTGTAPEDDPDAQPPPPAPALAPTPAGDAAADHELNHVD